MRTPFLLSIVLLTACVRLHAPTAETERATVDAAAPSVDAAAPSVDASPALDAAPLVDAIAARVTPMTTLDDLPAISDDGRRIAVAARVDDGARARENLALLLIDVDADRVIKRLVVVDANDPDAPGRDERTSAANRALADEHWSPLVKYEIKENAAAPERQAGMAMPFHPNMAAGEGLNIDYREPVLVVREGSTELLHRAMPAFTKQGHNPLCNGCTPCPGWLANLRAAWGDRVRGAVLVEVEYRGGTDTCWEPDQTFHAVRVPIAH